ncbi:MAG TPA: GNAT family acetyltransferase [Anaerolineaceae bacterium]|nr:GNAT family acetyltransferase [Anaerolineaceae bacterium]
MGPVSLREFAFPEDYPAVYRLWSQAGPGIQLRRSDEAEEIRKKIEKDPDLFLVAEAESEIVGTVLGGFDGRRGMVYHLAVAPAFREQGIATALMAELEKRLRVKGCIRYYLMVTRDNQEAIRFYERRGCKEMTIRIFGKDLD